MSAECTTCHAEVDWALSIDGTKRNPIDHGSADAPKGNLEVWYDGQHVLRYRYLRRGEEPGYGRHRGMSHFSTCPDADQHRRRR